MKVSYSLKEASAATGLSRSYFDQKIRDGALKAKRSAEPDEITGKSRGTYVIKAADLEAFIDGLADA